MFNQQLQEWIILPSAIFNIHIPLLINMSGAFHLLSPKLRGKCSLNDVQYNRSRKKKETEHVSVNIFWNDYFCSLMEHS